MAHEKFYDEFIELGYNASEFTDDFNNIVEVNDLKVKIDSEFDFNKLPNESLNFFISSFYTAKTRHSVEGKDNLLNLLTYLEEKDQELFGILDRSWNKWSNSNNLNNKELFEETETWLNNRKHSKQKI